MQHFPGKAHIIMIQFLICCLEYFLALWWVTFVWILLSVTVTALLSKVLLCNMKVNRLIIFKKMFAFYIRNNTEHINCHCEICRFVNNNDSVVKKYCFRKVNYKTLTLNYKLHFHSMKYIHCGEFHVHHSSRNDQPSRFC
jgi:hypothetical protein